MSIVKFSRGSYSNYNSDENGVYFSKDTNQILMGGVSYGVSVSDQNLINNSIQKKDNNTDVLLANGNLVEMTKFIGNIVYEESTGTLYFQTPLETEESIVASNVTVPTVTTSNDGLMTSEDLEKLNEIDIEEIR